MIRDLLEFTAVSMGAGVLGAIVAHFVLRLVRAWRWRRRQQEVDAWRREVRQLARRVHPQPGSEYDAIFRDLTAGEEWKNKPCGHPRNCACGCELLPLRRRPAELDDYDRRNG